jgi:hypothetical protein
MKKGPVKNFSAAMSRLALAPRLTQRDKQTTLTQEKKIMLRWIMRKQLDKFAKTFGYDTGYMHEMLDTSPRALRLFGGVVKFAGFCEDIPKNAWYAAKLTAVLAEDCGPCTQLGVTMAEMDGVPADELKAILSGDTDAMSPEAALCVKFTRAVLAHDPRADALRDAVVDCWGPKGLLSLATGIAATRVFPTVKYALGHGQACQRVFVGGEATAPGKPAPMALTQAAPTRAALTQAA